MTKILTSRPIIDENISKLKLKVDQIKSKFDSVPKMSVLLVGSNPASLSYVGHKRKKCEMIGAEFELLHLPEDTCEEEFLKHLRAMNSNPSIHGCFVQLPIPKQLSHLDPTEMIAQEKDIDGFGPKSIVSLVKGDESQFIPCTPKGIIKLLEFYKIDLEGKNVCVIGRSLIVGKPISSLLINRNATVTLCHSRTQNLKEFTQKSDIIISAVGKPRFLGKDFLNPAKKQVLIDVGINRVDNKLCGDIHFDEVNGSVYAITPVPGGVGPLTVLSLLENLIIAFEQQKEN